MNNLIYELRRELNSVSDENTRLVSQRFFKQTICTYGIKSALISKIAKEYFLKIKHLQKHELFALCEELWKSEFLEEDFIACHWSYALKKDYRINDFVIFEKWVHKYINNWASCDTFCNHNIGFIVQKYPSLIENLKLWTSSYNRWVRRAAAVSLIVPARKGEFSSEIFEISNLLLTDKDDMVQKGYGWLLKVLSQTEQQKVFDFVLNNRKNMPRTALRYAIEKMPDEMRKEAMKK